MKLTARNACMAGWLVFAASAANAAVDCSLPHDCEYYALNYYQTFNNFPPICLVHGEILPQHTFAGEIGPSFKVLNSQTAVRIDRDYLPAGYSDMFVYSEVSQPFLGGCSESPPECRAGGTDQYSDAAIHMSCLRKPAGRTDYHNPTSSFRSITIL